MLPRMLPLSARRPVYEQRMKRLGFLAEGLPGLKTTNQQIYKDLLSIGAKSPEQMRALEELFRVFEEKSAVFVKQQHQNAPEVLQEQWWYALFFKILNLAKGSLNLEKFSRHLVKNLQDSQTLEHFFGAINSVLKY
jgi:predicted transcriptional regulator